MKPSSWGWTVQQQLEKNKRLKLSDINDIQTWIKGEQYLPTITDEQVIMFLHACDYNVGQTKETIENCYIMRTNVKDFFSGRDFEHPYIQEVTKVAMYAPLAGFDKDGNLVIWMKLIDTDPHKYYYGVHMKYIHMLMDAIQLQYGPVPGYVFVLDGKGYTISHMLRTSLSLAKKFITYAQEASTFFPKAIYVLNVSSVMEKAVSFVKPFMKSDLFSVITFIKPGKYDLIQKQIPLEILPDEYGGQGGSLIQIRSEYLKKIAIYTEWFKEEEKLRIDEGKIKGNKASKIKKTLENTTNETAENLSLRTLAID